jgi:hypothetical protein
MKKLFAAALAFLAAAMPLSAKELIKPDPDKAALAAPTVRTIPGNPLQINVGSDQSYQVFNSAVPGSGQFYPSSATETADAGWFVRVDGVLYSPNFSDHPGGSATSALGTRTPFSEVSISQLSGAGTASDPYIVTVTTAIGATGLTARKRISYVNGENFYREQFRITNGTPTPRQVAVFLASDLYLAASDAGVPIREPVSGAPGGRTCDGISPVYNILHIPLSPADRYTATAWPTIWSQVGAGALDNAVAPIGCSDNGAGLQWNLQIGPNGAANVQAATSFGDVPAITGFNIFNVTPAQAGLGASLTVDITGVGFLPATTFDFGAGITVSNIVISSPTQARADLAIGQEAPFGFRDVIATQTPGGVTATLFQGFVVSEPPLLNYMVSPAFISPIVYNCIRNRYLPPFPVDATRHLPGWAPDEGEFIREIAPGILGGPRGLALDILECYIPLWNTQQGGLYPGYCWEEPTPTYYGEYPWQRYAHFRIFHAVNFVCTTPPPGTTVYESTVLMDRIEYFRPPMTRSGFEEW